MVRPPAPAAPGSTTKKSPKKAMSPRTAQLIAVGVALAFLAAIAAILITTLGGQNGGTALPETPDAGQPQIVRDDAHRLTEPAAAEVQLVEFLDFQCPACASAAAVVDEIKQQYGDRVEIVVRHFPLTEIHPHAVDAALAFEAAAAQGAAVEMYGALYGTQQQWSSGAGSQAAAFRSLAEQLGLDMADYDRVVADPATLEVVSLGRQDAIGLGLQGTPSFFIDGAQAQIETLDQLLTLVEQKLN
jgi:protein-disulfide isomerase